MLNIYDVAFFKNNLLLVTVGYFHEKLHLRCLIWSTSEVLQISCSVFFIYQLFVNCNVGFLVKIKISTRRYKICAKLTIKATEQR